MSFLGRLEKIQINHFTRWNQSELDDLKFPNVMVGPNTEGKIGIIPVDFFLSNFTTRIDEYNFEIVENQIGIPRFEILKIKDNAKKIIRNIYEDNSILFTIDPFKFEEIVAELLYSQGFIVKLTGRSKDDGYDILAIQNLKGFPLKFIVECKRYSEGNKVGVEIVRSFCDVINRQQANKGILVTTSYFTKGAEQRKAEMGAILDLRNKTDLVEWVRKYVENPCY